MPSSDTALPPSKKGFLASDDLGALFGGGPAASAAFYGVPTSAPRTRCSSRKGQDAVPGHSVQMTAGPAPLRPVLLTALSASASRTRSCAGLDPGETAGTRHTAAAHTKMGAQRRRPDGGRVPASLTWPPQAGLRAPAAPHPTATGHLPGLQVLIVSEGAALDYSHSHQSHLGLTINSESKGPSPEPLGGLMDKHLGG